MDESSSTLRSDGAPSAFKDYLDVLKRRKWTVIIVTVLFVAAAVGYSLKSSPAYQASVDVILTSQTPSSAITGIQSLDLTVNPDRTMETQAVVAREPVVVVAAMRQLHLQDMSVRSFLKHSSVSAAPNANVLTFAYQSAHPAVAVATAGAYAQQYVAYRRAFDRAEFAAASRQVQDRLDALAAAGESRSSLVSSLRSKQQQLQTMEAVQTPDAYVVSAPYEAIKTAPKRIRNGVLALVVGLVVGAGIAFLREALDTRVRTAREIGRQLDLPILAQVVEPSKQLRMQHQLALIAEPHGEQSEAFRVLRAQVELAAAEGDAQTVMITSAGGREGRSTVAANLAVAFARTGKRVVLVDLDLRQPFVHKFFGVTTDRGVVQAALGELPMKDALVRVDPEWVLAGSAEAIPDPPVTEAWRGTTWAKGRLDLLVAGAIPTDAGELIASQAITKALTTLASWYELVLIDAPPLLGGSGALALSAKVDATIVAVKLQTARRGMLAELRQMLQAAPSLKLGVVVTGARPHEAPAHAYAVRRHTEAIP